MAEHINAVVGRFYMVPCVRLIGVAKNTHHGADGDGWIPTIGPEHEDLELIGFPPMHFHIDVRFLSDRILRNFTPLQSVMLRPLCTWSNKTSTIAFELAVKRKKCMRLMPDFPDMSHLKTWGQFESHHADCKLKPGHICPHRGIDLTPFVKEDGTVVCPGHGLKWDTKTGDLLPSSLT